LDFKNLSGWLLERALEHDKPTLLFSMICKKLYSDKIIRPGITILEKMIISARQQAQEETYHRLSFLLTEENKIFLDKLLTPDGSTGRTPLFWLRYGATANTPKAILQTIEKLNFLRKGEVDQWDLGCLNPNRQKFLAQLGRKSTNQALQRASAQRRYPILISFLRQSLEDITDELIDLFIRCLADCYARAKNDLKEFRLSIAKSANEKLMMFRNIGLILLDENISDYELRGAIYERIPEEMLRSVIEECDELIRRRDDNSYDYLGKRFSYLRKFTPKFLETLDFQSIREDDSLLKALDKIRKLNSDGKRKVSKDAPFDFISKSWHPYVWDEEGKIIRKYYEISTLWELRAALRSGDIWVINSRRYADPESYLIPKDHWPSLCSEACRLLGLSEKGEERLHQRKDELTAILAELDQNLSGDSSVRIEGNKLVLTPLKAEDLLESSIRLKKLISERLPRVELADLLIEVDNWTRFTDKFVHAGGSQPRTKDLLTQIYASLMALACNFGLAKMAELSELTYAQLAWCTNWYIREETLQEAINTLVNYQYGQPLSHLWGGGTMSSSDGQRFPVPVKARNATALPRYFGYGRGLTFYTWTSDQFSQYGSKVIPSTVRDATYVLDAILDNETELEIIEHTTDTAGYTELVFALFDLLGMQFCPRIRDLGDQNLYRCEKDITYKHLEPCFAATINQKRILDNWDKILRIVASIKFGWVTASLLISKLQAYPRQNALTKILQEYGRLIKSIFIPRYLCQEDKRRRISIQLNKGEALHDLRRFLLFANEAKLRKSQIEEQNDQASALTLVTNAVIV
jgi:TnpA family transposase